MVKFLRVVLIAAGCVVVLSGLVLIAANLYVQSQGTQARIQHEISHRVGATVQIQRISVTPWGGLTLSGLTIPQTAPSQSGNFLEARSFRLRIQLSSLFSKAIVIEDVSLIEPVVVWPQNEKGKWRLPGSRRETEPDMVDNVPTASPASSATESSMPAESATAPAVASESSSPQRSSAVQRAAERAQARLKHVDVTRGDFRFLNRSGNQVANFENVNFRSALDERLALNGDATVEKVSLHDRFYLNNLQTPVHYAPDRLDLAKISARAAQGDVDGEFSLQPQAEDSPFDFSIHFRNLDANEIVIQAGGPAQTVQGKLEGSFSGHGASAKPNALTGTGEIFLRYGQVRQYSLLVALGQILQIEELTQLHLDQAEAKYHVDAGVISVDQLVLRSPNIRLSATGTIGFDGKMQLDSQLAINDKVRSQLFKPIRANFQPLDEPGLWAINFQVTGTVERPKSNLVEKVVGRDLKDLGSVINSFLGGAKSDRPKKKKREMEPPESAGVAPSPTPAESPAPAASASP